MPDFLDAEELTRLGGPSTERVSLSTAKLVESIPGVIHGVRDAVERDFHALRRGYRQVERENVTLSPSASLVDEDSIYLAAGVTVKAGAVLSAEDGPIYLDAGVTVHERRSARLLDLGPMSHANADAKLDGIAVGPGCKVGGEVHTTIVFGFSNKAHDGFMGHSYVGQWCNVGAGTDTSNLRNDYGPVSLYSMHERAMQLTGYQFMASSSAITPSAASARRSTRGQSSARGAISTVRVSTTASFPRSRGDRPAPTRLTGLISSCASPRPSCRAATAR